MIVIFGASSDIGQSLAARLKDAGHDVRRVSRSGDGDAQADLSTGAGVAAAMKGAYTVVSCAHARFTDRILSAVSSSVGKIVLTGSAWRYSKVPNPAAEQVRGAEAAFLSSNRSGVMLHPTMIYGGKQENNIRRLLFAIRRLPIIPAPGGGRQIVQPIHIDDVVQCLFAATTKNWSGPNVVAIAGPPLTWHKMVQSCASSIQCPKPIVSVPAFPIVAALSVLNKFGVNRFDANVVRRFREDVNVPIDEMVSTLSVRPRDFESGIRQAVAEWRREGALW
ncbi:MAG: hypothetical protein HY242_06965 [Afipia sp.]|nr:hypothetical protein [Afipia sp.]